MFFQNAFGGGGGPMGGSPSAFTSPGMDPQALKMLMMMQQGGGGMGGPMMGGPRPGGMPGGAPQMGGQGGMGGMPGGPQLPPPPQGGGNSAPPMQPMPGVKQPQDDSANILQQLSKLGGIKPGGANGGAGLGAMLGGTGGYNGVGGLLGQLGQWLGLNPGVTGGGFGDFSPRGGGAYF